MMRIKLKTLLCTRQLFLRDFLTRYFYILAMHLHPLCLHIRQPPPRQSRSFSHELYGTATDTCYAHQSASELGQYNAFCEDTCQDSSINRSESENVKSGIGQTKAVGTAKCSFAVEDNWFTTTIYVADADGLILSSLSDMDRLNIRILWWRDQRCSSEGNWCSGNNLKNVGAPVSFAVLLSTVSFHKFEAKKTSPTLWPPFCLNSLQPPLQSATLQLFFRWIEKPQRNCRTVHSLPAWSSTTQEIWAHSLGW